MKHCISQYNSQFRPIAEWKSGRAITKSYIFMNYSSARWWLVVSLWELVHRNVIWPTNEKNIKKQIVEIASTFVRKLTQTSYNLNWNPSKICRKWLDFYRKWKKYVYALAKVLDRNSFRANQNYYDSFQYLYPTQCESFRTNPKDVL